MHKKYLVISATLVGILSILTGFFWYIETSRTTDEQKWATHVQRLDSGDTLTIDYPAELAPVYKPSYGVANVATETLSYVLHFYARDAVNSHKDILITQLPRMTQAQIGAERIALATQLQVSRWHLGKWTAYETEDPGFYEEIEFSIDGRGLSFFLSGFSKTDAERIMSSVRWNDISLSKFDSMQNWDWPAIPAGR